MSAAVGPATLTYTTVSSDPTRGTIDVNQRVERHNNSNKALKVAACALAAIATIGFTVGAILSGVGILTLPVALPLGIKVWTAFAAGAGLSAVLSFIAGYFASKKPKPEVMREFRAELQHTPTQAPGAAPNSSVELEATGIPGTEEAPSRLGHTPGTTV
jgi:hypothetical protein